MSYPTIEHVDAEIAREQEHLSRLEREAGHVYLTGRPWAAEETAEIRATLRDRLMQLRAARAILEEREQGGGAS